MIEQDDRDNLNEGPLTCQDIPATMILKPVNRTLIVLSITFISRNQEPVSIDCSKCKTIGLVYAKDLPTVDGNTCTVSIC